MEVCVIKPSSVEDAREITETLLSGRTVILNLEGLDLEVAQRISLYPDQFGKAFRAGVEGVIARGKTELEDKTMIDALLPSIDAFDAAVADGAGLHDAIESAQQAAAAGRDATIPMVARKGRASYLGERSAGHLDPGAASATYLWDALADVTGA